MPVKCFLCNHEGHKQKFCEFYHFRWGGGEEEGRVNHSLRNNLNGAPNDLLTCFYSPDYGFTSKNCDLNAEDFITPLKNSLENQSLWLFFKIGRTPRDGHCLMYALMNSLESQFPDEKPVSKDYLLNLLQRETSLNIDTYSAFMSDICVNITDLMDEYILHRNYDTRYGDAIPLIMANALKKDILIIEYSSTGIDRVRHESPTFVPSRKLSPLVLFKCGIMSHACFQVLLPTICWTVLMLKSSTRHCPACRTYLIATRFWVVVICPIIKCLTVLEFSFILFDLCLFITIFNFILNYVPIVTFWIFTYHKIWILLIIFCFIWNYWIYDFLTCLEVFWSVVS